ncbi:SRPBCC domain-containing protein [Micromonospora siamensis]|uniref:Uncharacterized conserved protein YndB, AHSA1/START domain n=1 Tax=Micromonospora siamensis TaxID=299152 RepID=A0A1C5H491_9ACTN|nr:SRPBCC domain-containing protein [Micromonospora siamensis]SCG40842.1 Uncharacterized conserved protein YndB, AHSA1/START domain [Micromonospora siamensis]
MEYGSIEREIHVDAPPETVFDVVSNPAHIRDWWNAETDIEPVAGSTGELTWRDEATGRTDVVPITVGEVRPPRLFSFRWTQDAGQAATAGNSLLVTFELTPAGDGTLLRLTETGFRERGWEIAVLEKAYHEHVTGWDFFLPRIAERAARVPGTERDDREPVRP